MAKKNKSLLDLQRSAERFLEKSFADDVAPLINAEVEFSHIQLKDIIVHDQVRSKDDMDPESLKELMESITEKGVLQPVLVYKEPEKGSHKYILVAGERRYLASKALNKPHIPARILLQEPTGIEIIEMQLIENLQRKDLNPVDEALGYVQYYATRIDCPDLQFEKMSSDLYTYTTRPESLKNDVALIISAIEKLSGKSISYVRKVIGLLRLPDEAILAVKSGTLGVTQAIMLADYSKHPKFDKVLAQALSGKMTVKAIEAAFKQKTPNKPVFSTYKKRIGQLSRDLQKNVDDIPRDFAEQLLLQTEELLKTIKSILKRK